MKSDKDKIQGDMAVALIRLIEQIAEELHPQQKRANSITLDTSLDQELGLDSLTRMELLSRIEHHFKITLSERAFVDAQTTRDLLRAVEGASRASAPTTVVKVAEPARVGKESVPDGARNLADVLRWHVEKHPDRIHIRFCSDKEEEEEEEPLTYGGLREGAESVAAGLQYLGLRHGEPVSIMLPTSREYFFSFYGILIAGGVPVPIYPPVRMTQIEDHLRRHQKILSNCAASILITIPEALVVAKLLKSQLTSMHHLVSFEELVSKPGKFAPPVLGEHDIAFLQYTSGSTGQPKGVILTHDNLLVNIRTMGERVNVVSSDVFMSWLPLYHDMGLIGAWLGSMYYGIPLVIMPPLSFLARPQRWFWAIHKYRATLSAAPNFAYEICLKRLKDDVLEGLDLSSWRAAFNGAEPVSPETLNRFCDRFGKYGFRKKALMPVYGLAESSVGLAFPPLDQGPLIDRIDRDIFMGESRAVPAEVSDSTALRFVGCGQPLAGHEIRVVDENMRELPERQVGHLQFRGPSACKGYFRNPDETRKLFKDTWLDTGDLAYITAGNIFITGRTKDIIIRAGRNITPSELEEGVSEVPGIRKGNVAVFGAADRAGGTQRLVILAETREQDPKVLEKMRISINALSTELTGTPPDDVVLAPPGTVPKTSSGKIRRASSRERYENDLLDERPKKVWRQVAGFALAGLVPTFRRMRNLGIAGLYAAFAWSMFCLITPVVWTGVALLPYLSWRWKFIRTAGRMLAAAIRIPISIDGLSHLRNLPPCILVSNHASYLDGLVLSTMLPMSVSFVGKSELAAHFRTRFFLDRIKTEYVERFDKKKGIEDARLMNRRIEEGRSLLFFPEGTLTRMPGLLPFHMGAFITAAETGVPVIPIAIRGTRSILRSGSWFPRKGKVSVTIGAPIQPDSAAEPADTAEPVEQDAWQRALELRDRSREHILRFCGEPDLGYEKSPV